MGRRMKMFRGVFVLRRVAAAHVAADQAQAQVHPAVACFQALLASLCIRLNVPDLIQMRALVHKRTLFQLIPPVASQTRYTNLSWTKQNCERGGHTVRV